MITLEEVIKGCKQNNKFAQHLLYERYSSLMRGVCLRYMNDLNISNDIVQDGFIKVFSNIKNYKGTGSFEGWMKRIFINTAISYLRKHNKTNRFLNIDELNEYDLTDQNLNNHINEENKIDRKDIINEPIDFQTIQAAEFSEVELLGVLGKLPERYRVVFNLYSIENLKHEEIADLLDIEIATSRSRLLRARALIKNELLTMCMEKLSV